MFRLRRCRDDDEEYYATTLCRRHDVDTAYAVMPQDYHVRRCYAAFAAAAAAVIFPLSL